MTSPAPKVSVVVPVYNPGPYLERCVESILGQSLAAGELEAIFVDDGSTDGSGARLDELAARHPHVRVIHQENSGWPGKPRNVGMDAARGEYVFFADNDDVLGPEALERLHALATRSAADIVVGKMVGRGRSAATGVYRENLEGATLADTPSFILALTPHKLFRRAFLREHGLRFPEGRRRLEDQVFVAEAYFAAKSISILADYICYYQLARGDRANASRSAFDPTGRFDPAYYYRYLRDVLDVIEAHTEPGHFRDRLLRRFVNRELLGRLRGRRFVGGNDAFRAALLDEVGSIVERYVPESVDALLAPLERVRITLLRAGRHDLLLELARAERSVVAVARARRLSGRRGQALGFEAEVGLADEAGPLTFGRSADQLILPLPDAVAAAVAPEASRFASREPGTVRVSIRHRGDLRELAIPASVVTRVTDTGKGARVRYAVSGTIPLATDLQDADLREGQWELVVRVDLAGFSCETFLRRPSGGGLRGTLAIRDWHPTWAAARWAGRDHHLVFAVGATGPRRPSPSLRRRARHALGVAGLYLDWAKKRVRDRLRRH